MACDIASSDGVCDLSCAEDDKVISASTPRYQPCGVLGVYDWKMPHKTLVLSTCTGKYHTGRLRKKVIQMVFYFIVLANPSSQLK